MDKKEKKKSESSANNKTKDNSLFAKKKFIRIPTYISIENKHDSKDLKINIIG
jgi:hypothetical protein